MKYTVLYSACLIISLLVSPSILIADHRPTAVFEGRAGNTWITVHHWGLSPVFIWVRGDQGQPLHQKVNNRLPEKYQAMFPNYTERSFTVVVQYLEGIERTIRYVPGERLLDRLNPPGLLKSWGGIKEHFVPVVEDTTALYPVSTTD